MQAKVIGGAIGGSIATIMFWILATYAGVDVPAHVAGAATMLISTGVAWAVSETGADIPVVGVDEEKPGQVTNGS